MMFEAKGAVGVHKDEEKDKDIGEELEVHKGTVRKSNAEAEPDGRYTGTRSRFTNPRRFNEPGSSDRGDAGAAGSVATGTR